MTTGSKLLTPVRATCMAGVGSAVPTGSKLLTRVRATSRVGMGFA